MAKKNDWDKVRREKNASRKCTLPKRKNHTNRERSEIETWYNSLTKNQKRLIYG